ncbi:MAG: porin, partial [Rhizobiaceae bacterium]
MNIKSLLLGSAAALAAVSGAQAADAIVAAEPEPMEYVRVCDAFGTGYFYIPGTETCLKVGGRVRFDAAYGSAYSPDADGLYTNNTRTRLMVATIELGGFAVGLQDSLYESFIDYAGNVDSDDVINYGPSEVNMVAYTYKGGNGFSAFAALEDDGQNDNDTAGGASDWPNVAAGLKYDTGNFMVGVTGGYDESVEEGAVKARVGGKFGAFTAFLMGGWNSDGDSFNSYAPEIIDGFGWGDWAVWGGAGYEFNEDLAANMQVSYSDSDVLSAVANLQWTPIQGFLIQPEIAYTKWNNATLDD